MMSKFRLLVLLNLAFALACSDQRSGNQSGWFLDSSFSRHLLGSSQFYKLYTKQDAADTVDALQIFKTRIGEDTVFSVDEIRSREWVYETTRRKEIVAFFRAAQNTLPDNANCSLSASGVVFLVLAFDRDLMRVAYFKYYPCKGYHLGALKPYGSSALYFSSDVVEFVERGRQRREGK